jgi:hypothetical protein
MNQTYSSGPGVFQRLKTLGNGTQYQAIAMIFSGTILANVKMIGVDGGGVSTPRKLSRIWLNNLHRQLAVFDARALTHTCTVYVGFVS